jgi:hypothetical protein
MQWLDLGCLSGLQGLVAMFGCNVWLQCLVAMFGYMECNRHLLKQRRAFGPIGLSAKPFPNREFERDKKVTSLLETFYKLYLLDKKKSINTNYNGLQGIGPPVDRSIFKPFQIVNLREKKQNLFLC